MASVAIVTHSGTGYTAIAAAAVARGAASLEGTEISFLTIEPDDFEGGRWSNATTLEALDAADAIVFGSPTYMGGPSAQMKALFDATLDRYSTRAWKDKVAAGFTVSSTPSGDKLHTLVAMATFAMQMGMIWVGLDQVPLNADGLNRLSVYFGAAAQSDYTVDGPAIDRGDEATAELLGARVAEITRRLRD